MDYATQIIDLVKKCVEAAAQIVQQVCQAILAALPLIAPIVTAIIGVVSAFTGGGNTTAAAQPAAISSPAPGATAGKLPTDPAQLAAVPLAPATGTQPLTTTAGSTTQDEVAKNVAQVSGSGLGDAGVVPTTDATNL